LSESRDLSLQSPGRPERSLDSHRQILERIIQRDVEGARAAMEYHISQVEPAQFIEQDGIEAAHRAVAGLST